MTRKSARKRKDNPTGHKWCGRMADLEAQLDQAKRERDAYRQVAIGWHPYPSMNALEDVDVQAQRLLGEGK